MDKNAIIIGAGPAGLTAAYELLQRTDIHPIILERSGDIGGISKTVNYKGNRMDIGGHRFFSKSDRVMQWWLKILPLEREEDAPVSIQYRRQSRSLTYEKPSSPVDKDKVMLLRRRLSRIYFLRKFFAYPIQLSLETLRKLGPWRTSRILASYVHARIFPRKPERSLEDFFVNRFGTTLYRLFFKDYTEKVWGVPCSGISAEWGAQRIKGVSVGKAVAHALKSLKPGKNGDYHQKNIETSLIEQFLYPKFGPGQLWEEVARQVKAMGGEILMQYRVQSLHPEGHRITSVKAVHSPTGEVLRLEGDYFFSTMPVKELVTGVEGGVPDDVREIAEGLQYRDFITVGVLLRQWAGRTGDLKDTWIYIQEKGVKVGRLQLFHNWSPFMVRDPKTIWVGMEYFCDEGDAFWNQSDADIRETAVGELAKMGLAAPEDVLDATVLRMEKTYPAYFGTYDQFSIVQEYLVQFTNLFLVGRNGMHKYNNADHSMLTAMVAVDNIVAGRTDQSNIWAINTEQEYHEEKASAPHETARRGGKAA